MPNNHPTPDCQFSRLFQPPALISTPPNIKFENFRRDIKLLLMFNLSDPHCLLFSSSDIFFGYERRCENGSSKYTGLLFFQPTRFILTPDYYFSGNFPTPQLFPPLVIRYVRVNERIHLDRKTRAEKDNIYLASTA